MSSQTLSLWLTLARLPGVGPRGRVLVFERFASIEAVFAASRAALTDAFAAEVFASAGRVDVQTAIAALRRGPDAQALAPDLAWLAAEPQRHLITWGDADYPPLLRQIADPPLVLYVHGQRKLLVRPQLAIVGSRNPTALGRQTAAAFARSLAANGLAITSGLALGIDAAAHRGALDADGLTVAVCGTGLDRVYPPRNRELAHTIAAHGALVSELPIGTPVRPGNFPVRNRVISGLSLGVLVVEAALRSGSLITARLAAEQGREVFALPGSIHSPMARGCHALIRQGAKLVETAADVLEELGALAQVSSVVIDAPAAQSPALARIERQVLDCLGYEPTRIDAVIERSGLTADTVSSILLQLELRGLVLNSAGGYQRAP
jgi:DNA processing protein